MAKAIIRKDRKDDTGYPWHYSIDTEAGDPIDYGSVLSQPEALANVEHVLTHRSEFDNPEES